MTVSVLGVIYPLMISTKLELRDFYLVCTLFAPRYIYIRTVSSLHLFSGLLNRFKLVYGLFGQSNMHRTLNFFPEKPWKETNVPKLKSRCVWCYCPNIYTVFCIQCLLKVYDYLEILTVAQASSRSAFESS